jgi:hypothetical protein
MSCTVPGGSLDVVSTTAPALAYEHGVPRCRASRRTRDVQANRKAAKAARAARKKNRR